MEKVDLPRFITRQYIEQHPEISFVFGDSFRSGECSEQPAICGYKFNTFPIPTCKCFSMGPQEGRWTDEKDYGFMSVYILKHIRAIPTTKPILVLHDIGVGGSADMPRSCPKLYELMISELKKLPNITFL